MKIPVLKGRKTSLFSPETLRVSLRLDLVCASSSYSNPVGGLLNSDLLRRKRANSMPDPCKETDSHRSHSKNKQSRIYCGLCCCRMQLVPQCENSLLFLSGTGLGDRNPSHCRFSVLEQRACFKGERLVRNVADRERTLRHLHTKCNTEA